MEDVIIRPYRPQDRGAVRDIAWQTAFMGESGDIFFQGKEILADFLTLYFTDHEPQSCFVAESSGEIIGYLTGARDVRVLRKVFHSHLLRALCVRAFTQGVLFNKKNLVFSFYCLRSLLKGEFKEPDFSKEYPATLHINLKKDFRNTGTGARLIAAYLEYLKRHKVTGVHFGSISAIGASFFKKSGFEVLHQSTRSYFSYILHKSLPVYIFGKHI